MTRSVRLLAALGITGAVISAGAVQRSASARGQVAEETPAAILAADVTITRYQAGSARVMVCQDGHGFVVFHPGGRRETYGSGFTLETIEWFQGLESARSRQVVADVPGARCTRDLVRPPRRVARQEEPTATAFGSS